MIRKTNCWEGIFKDSFVKYRDFESIHFIQFQKVALLKLKHFFIIICPDFRQIGG